MEDCANPLFTEWLKEWMDEARIRNSKGHLVYKKAYQSMKACDTVLPHASEASQLNGIGPKLCSRLAEKHIEYCNQNGLPPPQKPRRKTRIGDNANESDKEETETAEPPAKKQRKQKEYVPTLGSGAYALVLALSELGEAHQGLTKKDLIARAQPHTTSSFTVPEDNSKYYTAWKSMETLEKKELVQTRGLPNKRYILTEDGWATARRMRAHNAQASLTESAALNDSSKASETNSARTAVPAQNPSSTLEVMELDSDVEPEVHATPLRKLVPINDSGLSGKKANTVPVTDLQPIVLQPGTFDVKLLIDSREIQSTNNRDYIADQLQKKGIDVQVRALPLGDALWIAKLRSPHDAALRCRNEDDDDEFSDEIVLEHIVERKRLDDLMYSIRDGRFHEQKFRLKKSGLQNVTYLVEEKTISAEKLEAFGASMESAIAQMQIVDDIFVKQTSKTDDTIRYLERMTKSLKRMYEQKELHVLPSASLDVANHHKRMKKLRDDEPTKVFGFTFSAFCSLCDKSESLTLRDLYLKMLMCMKGVTGDKAIEIQKIWPTPNALIEAYNSLDTPQAKNKMVSDRLGKRIQRKQVTETLSTKIAEVWAN